MNEGIYLPHPLLLASFSDSTSNPESPTHIARSNLTSTPPPTRSRDVCNRFSCVLATSEFRCLSCSCSQEVSRSLYTCIKGVDSFAILTSFRMTGRDDIGASASRFFRPPWRSTFLQRCSIRATCNIPSEAGLPLEPVRYAGTTSTGLLLRSVYLVLGFHRAARRFRVATFFSRHYTHLEPDVTNALRRAMCCHERVRQVEPITTLSAKMKLRAKTQYSRITEAPLRASRQDLHTSKNGQLLVCVSVMAFIPSHQAFGAVFCGAVIANVRG